MSLSPSQFEFLTVAAQAGVVAEHLTGCPAELSVAQALLESDWGTRAPCCNYFGVKHTDGPDNYQLTKEYIDGTWRSLRLDFQAYDSPADAFIAHARLLTAGTPYAAAWAAYQADPNHDLDALARGIAARYATDPSYADKVTELCHGPHITSAVAAARANHG